MLSSEDTNKNSRKALDTLPCPIQSVVGEKKHASPRKMKTLVGDHVSEMDNGSSCIRLLSGLREKGKPM